MVLLNYKEANKVPALFTAETVCYNAFYAVSNLNKCFLTRQQMARFCYHIRNEFKREVEQNGQNCDLRSAHFDMKKDEEAVFKSPASVFICRNNGVVYRGEPMELEDLLIVNAVYTSDTVIKVLDRARRAFHDEIESETTCVSGSADTRLITAEA